VGVNHLGDWDLVLTFAFLLHVRSDLFHPCLLPRLEILPYLLALTTFLILEYVIRMYLTLR